MIQMIGVVSSKEYQQRIIQYSRLNEDKKNSKNFQIAAISPLNSYNYPEMLSRDFSNFYRKNAKRI